MHQVISPYVPFPNLYWWSLAIDTECIMFDVSEHFEKMSYRNRYYITGANGLIQLNIPLSKGRNQRTAMKDVLIDHTDNWQQTHIRTIKSVYGRAAYYDFFMPELEGILSKEYRSIYQFSKETIHWLKKSLNIAFEEEEVNEFQAEYRGIKDIRKKFKPAAEKQAIAQEYGLYYQLFQERNGFIPNLSVLDLLFSEGPAAAAILKEHHETVGNWHKL